MFKNCTEADTLPRFQKSESGKTFAIELNAKENFVCEIIDIEKCVLQNAGFPRCDWLFLVPKGRGVNEHVNIGKPKAYYVELKGIDIYHACEQLYNAIDRTKADILNFDIEAVIVSSIGRQPEIANNKYYKKVKKMILKDILIHKVHKGNSFKHLEKI